MEPNEYTNNQTTWLKNYLDAEIKAMREAVNKVEVVNDTKFSSLKEDVKKIEVKIGELDKVKNNNEGRLLVVGVIWTLIIVLLSWYLNKH